MRSHGDPAAWSQLQGDVANVAVSIWTLARVNEPAGPVNFPPPSRRWGDGKVRRLSNADGRATLDSMREYANTVKKVLCEA